MMGKSKAFKKIAEKIVHTTPFIVWIGAGKATPGPPLGPQLGQRIPVPCWISITQAGGYNLQLSTPPINYFLKQATGAERGAMEPKSGEIAGKLSLKHVYEIAKVKSQDEWYDCVPLPKICQEIIDEARYMGFEVVKDLDAKEYAEFLKYREEVIKDQVRMIEEKRAAKLQRV